MFKTDCIHFVSDRPCVYHKKTNVICENCRFYESIKKHKSSRKKIVIIKLSSLGDVLRTTCILKPLHKKYKHPAVYWITYKNTVPLLHNITYIKEILPYNAKILSRVLVENFDIMINLDLSIDALILTSLVKSKIKLGYWLDPNEKNICFNKEAERWFVLSHNDVLKKKNKKTYQQHMMNVIGIKTKSLQDYKIPINLSKNEKEFAKEFAGKHAIYRKQNKVSQKPLIIGLNTGGGTEWPKKEWPIEHTIELINLLYTKKSPCLFKILLFGGEKEKERNRKIVESLKFPHSLIDTGASNTLRQFMALVNLCDIVVTTDTLALHVALGLNKKVIALFGPTSAEEIEMYGLGKKIISPIKCSVCYNRKCSKEPDCMDLVVSGKVYKTITSLI